jgi:endonuclease/exonuclease/phosphatase family metal-dependent hydrolase
MMVGRLGRWATLAVAAILLLAASAWAEPLRVMSFNIRGDFDLEKATDSSEAWNSVSNEHRRDMVAKTIADYDPDVLGVQEAFQHQLTDLEQTLPGYKFYGVGRDDGKQSGEQCAIFYRSDRFRLLNHGTFWLSKTPEEAGTRYPDAACNRVATWMILADQKSNGQEFLVINTHFDHVSKAAQEHGAKLIRERMNGLAKGRPTIVMGDLNAGEESQALAALRGDSGEADQQLVDSFREFVPERGGQEATFHNFGGSTAGSRIDFILHSGDLHTTDAAIVHTKFGDRYPSDHFPITATLAIADTKSDAATKAPR